jgi:hypothetical protein
VRGERELALGVRHLEPRRVGRDLGVGVLRLA